MSFHGGSPCNARSVAQSLGRMALLFRAFLAHVTPRFYPTVDETRRYRNFAPFVRRTGGRKAQTCANGIFQELHERCVHPPSRPGSLRGPNDGSSLSDGQYEYAAAAAACAANVPGVAARSCHKHVQVSRTRDQTGRNWDLQLLTADNRGAQGLPVDDNDRRRNKLAALYGEHSTLLHLSKIHRAR